MIFSIQHMADQLEQMAMGEAYFGNALQVAKEIPRLTQDELELIDRFATGQQKDTDHIDLQQLVIKLKRGIAA